MNLTDTRPLLTGTVPLLLSGPFYGTLNAPRTVAARAYLQAITTELEAA